MAFCSSAFGQVDNKPDKTPPSEKTPVAEKAGERLIDDGKIKSVIEDLLGETLDGYKDFGFKDVTLGSDLSKMRIAIHLIGPRKRVALNLWIRILSQVIVIFLMAEINLSVIQKFLRED